MPHSFDLKRNRFFLHNMWSSFLDILCNINGPKLGFPNVGKNISVCFLYTLLLCWHFTDIMRPLLPPRGLCYCLQPQITLSQTESVVWFLYFQSQARLTFPVIEVGTFLKHSKLKFSQTEKCYLKKKHTWVLASAAHILKKNTLGDGQNLWYSVIMVLCRKVELGP